MPPDHVSFNIEDGLSQSERRFAALEETYALPDEQGTGDLLRQTAGFAALVNYYNFNDQPDGTWEEFFDSDVDLLVHLISEADVKSFVLRFEAVLAALHEAESSRTAAQELQTLFSTCGTMLATLLKFESRLQLARNRQEGMAALRRILAGTRDSLRTQFVQAYGLAQQLNGGFSLPVPLAARLGLPPGGEPLAAQTADSRQQVLNPLYPLLNRLFNNLKQRYSLLAAESGRYLLNLRPQGNVYEPHLGLYMAFANLYGYLQKSINSLPGRHLDYYYRELLGLRRRGASPDRTWLVLRPLPGAAPVEIGAGEAFRAPVPDSPEEDIFEWQRGGTITDASIGQLFTSYMSPEPAEWDGSAITDRRLYLRPVRPLEPGEFLKQEHRQSWPLMGEDQSVLPFESRNMDEARLGLVLSSPLLNLQDGERTVQLRLYFTAGTGSKLAQQVAQLAERLRQREQVVLQRLLREAFQLSVSTAEGWLAVERLSLRQSLLGDPPYMDFIFVLGQDAPAMTAYNAPAPGEPYRLDHPAVRFLVNSNTAYSAAGIFSDAVLERVSISVKVTGASIFSLRNNLGPLSPAGPFQPFGPSPSVGSFFEITAPSVFNRYLSSFRLRLEWMDLPTIEGGFTRYYQEYRNGTTSDSFRVGLSSVVNGRPQPESGQQETAALFEDYRDDNMQVYLRSSSAISYELPGRLSFDNEAAPSATFEPDPQRPGVLRVQLTDPPDAFGHRLYPTVFSETLSHNARRLASNRPIPNTPYLPFINRLTIDYALAHTELIRRGSEEDEEAEVRILHLGATGYEEVYPRAAAGVSMLPETPPGASLYLGLRDAVAQQELSLLFVLEEMNFLHTLQQLDAVQWSCLHQNSWWPLNELDVLEDGTEGFTRTGVVILKLPSDVSTEGNSLFPEGLFWLRASVPSGRTAQSRALAIFAQAGEAVRRMKSGDEGKAPGLKAGAITAPQAKLPGIGEVWQPVASVGGRGPESETDFRVRVSERLRHKDRPLTVLDISQLILQEFPSILMVRCLSSNGTYDSLVVPDINIQIIVIPRTIYGRVAKGAEPQVNLATLLSIKAFINARLSCFAAAEVGNPVYEQIKIVCAVKLRQGTAGSRQGHLVAQLNDDIRRFVTPWLYDGSEAIQIGSRMYVAGIAEAIRKLPYVERVSNFSVLHFYSTIDPETGQAIAHLTDTARSNLAYIEASRRDAILVAAPRNIIHIEDDAYAPPLPSGIGRLIIGKELNVSKPQEDESLLPALRPRSSGEDELFNFALDL